MPENPRLTNYLKTVARRIPLARKCWQAVRFRKRQWRGDYPASREIWETQYRQGFWDYMKQIDELARYSVIAGYFQYLKRGGRILDVGCGTGILQELLTPHVYSEYIGIDISAEAISQASQRADEKTLFVAAKATEYVPPKTFDVIVFNETLYYFDEPLKVMKRYERYLNKDGIFITSMYLASERATSIWRNLKNTYHSINEVTQTNNSKSWVCNIFVPIQKTA